MNIGFGTGWAELGNYWGTDWLNAKMLGGSERILLNLAREFTNLGHRVTVRLPYNCNEFTSGGIHFVPPTAVGTQFDLVLAFDNYRVEDVGRTVLIACRSDPPRHTNFDQMVFLSAHHARLMGHEGRPYVGGGVDLADYQGSSERVARRVICNSSPDRCSAAGAIGRSFDFVHSYRPVPGLPPTVELDRPALVELQRTAQVLIYPLDPRRPSDFFSMSVLEAMAAGTPVIVSDGDSMPELWQDAAIVLPLPIRLAEWVDAVEQLLASPKRWQRYSDLGRKKAENYSWGRVAARYLEVCNGNI